MKIAVCVLLVIAVFLIGGLALINTTAASITAPRIALGATESLNWAGYAVVVQQGEVNAAYGSWIVPTISCGKQTTYAAFWVGIDGYNDSTVEQTGILTECQHGSAVYSAWYEFYPSAPVYAPSSDAVKPGDKIVANVVYSSSGNCFTTTLEDITEAWTYTSPCTSVSGALRSSAEWITERPAIGRSLTTLADFGKAYYGQYYTGVPGTNYVTIGSTNYTISGSPNYVSITMVNNGGQVLAAPSPLTGGGTSFYVTYQA
jgi:hypothetical protein